MRRCNQCDNKYNDCVHLECPFCKNDTDKILTLLVEDAIEDRGGY